jgi:hypothetical protein
MGQIWAAASLVTFLLMGQTTAADQAQQAETARSKAPASSRGGVMAFQMTQRRKSPTRTPRKSPARPSTASLGTEPVVPCISTIGN